MLEVFKALAEYGVEMEINYNKFVPNGCVSVKFSKGDYRRAYIFDYDKARCCIYPEEKILLNWIERFADECDELVEKEEIKTEVQKQLGWLHKED